jgi:hypothetical protein
MLIPLIFIILIFYNRVAVPAQFLAFSISLVPLSAALVSIYLISFSVAFGYTNQRYTFFMAKISKKFAKYIGIVLLQYVVMIFVLGAFGIFTIFGFLSFWGGIALMLGLSLGILAATEVAAKRMFA